MKKTLYVVIFVLILMLVFTTGCKKLKFENWSWYLVEGNGSYSSQNNTSSIKLSSFLTIEQPRIVYEYMKANIRDWQYVLYEGDAIVGVITPTNYVALLGDNFPGISGWQDDYLWVQIQVNGLDGDLFNGSNPDTMSIVLIIEDEKNNFYQVSAMAPFAFTRD
jgi:hypothetical protein